jgi:hypothetical protein
MPLNRARRSMISKDFSAVVILFLFAVGRTEPTIWLDYATFHAEDTENTRVEISLKLPTDSLGITVEESEKVVRVALTVTVEDSVGRALLTDRWERRLGPPPETRGPDHDVYFLDSSTLDLVPGLYGLSVRVVDKSNGSVDILRAELVVPS